MTEPGKQIPQSTIDTDQISYWTLYNYKVTRNPSPRANFCLQFHSEKVPTESSPQLP